MSKVKKPKQLIFKSENEFRKAVNAHYMPMLQREIDTLQLAYKDQLTKAKIDATQEALIFLLPISCTALYEAYGFAEKRQESFINYFTEHIQCLEDGITSVDQYRDWCLDKGIKYFKVVEVLDEVTNS